MSGLPSQDTPAFKEGGEGTKSQSLKPQRELTASFAGSQKGKNDADLFQGVKITDNGQV